MALSSVKVEISIDSIDLVDDGSIGVLQRMIESLLIDKLVATLWHKWASSLLG